MPNYLTHFARAGLAFALISVAGYGTAQAQTVTFTAPVPNGVASVQFSAPAVVNEAPQPVYVYQPPPPPAPVVYTQPAPRPGYVFVNGHHAWAGNRWVWTPGHWIVAQPGCTWVAPYYDSGRRVWVGGHWRRGHIRAPFPGHRVVYAPFPQRPHGPVIVHRPGPLPRGPVVVHRPAPRPHGTVFVPGARPHHRGPVVAPAPRPAPRGPAAGQRPRGSAPRGGQGRGAGHGQGGAGHGGGYRGR